MEKFEIFGNVLIKASGRDKVIVIPEGIEEIGERAFYNKNIKEVILPESIKTIGRSAFTGCYNLQEINFPSGLSEICPNAFSCCDSLRKVIFEDGLHIIGDCAFSGCRGLEEVYLPGSIEEIKGYAFANCEKLSDLHIPDTSIKIEEGAFYGCSSLADKDGFITVKGTVYGFQNKAKELSEMIIKDGVAALECYAEAPELITDLRIPESVERISAYGGSDPLHDEFRDMRNLKSCSIGAAVHNIQYANYIVRKIFGVEILTDVFLNGRLTADDVLIDALIKNINLKHNRKMLISKYAGLNQTEKLAKLLKYIKPVQSDELAGYVSAAEDAGIKTVLLGLKTK